MARRPYSILACALLPVLLVACGGDSQGRVTTSLQSFATETAASGTARFSVKTTSSDRAQGGPDTLQSGVFDFKSSDGRFTESRDGVEDMSSIVVDGAVFIPMKDMGPIDRQDECYGKTWGVFDYPKYAREGWPVNKAGASPVPIDPGRVLASLKDANAAVTRVGSETLRGTETTRYRVKVGSPELAAAFTDSDEHSQERLTSLDVWVDSEQRLRQARAVVAVHWGGETTMGSITLPVEFGSGSYDETTTFEVWDYGVPVQVTRPADSDSCDFPEFFGRTMNTFD